MISLDEIMFLRRMRLIVANLFIGSLTEATGHVVDINQSQDNIYLDDSVYRSNLNLDTSYTNLCAMVEPNEDLFGIFDVDNTTSYDPNLDFKDAWCF